MTPASDDLDVATPMVPPGSAHHKSTTSRGAGNGKVKRLDSYSLGDDVDDNLQRVDAMWAAESPLHVEWREGTPKTGPFAPLFGAVLALVASARVYFMFLVTVESILVSALSVASVLLFSLYKVHGNRLAVDVSWAFISFAIVFPLTNSLNEAFRRREEALRMIGEVKAYLLSYYQGHRDWDWGANGRGKLPAGHLSQVRYVVAQLVVDMRDVLTAPNTTRQEHFHTEWGRRQRLKMATIYREINQRIASHFDKISHAVEELKYGGMPGNESSRLRQYVTLTMCAWEKLKFIKKYRTPIATRAFARVYIFLHPIFWGPYYARLVEQMVGDDDASAGASSPSASLVVWANVYACTLAVLTSLAMMGLFNVRYNMEDPFCTDVRTGGGEMGGGGGAEAAGEKGGASTRSDRSSRAVGASQHISKGGMDLIHVNQEFAELMECVMKEATDAGANPCGGGPTARVWPVPELSKLAHVTFAAGVDVTRIAGDVDRQAR